MQTPQHLYDKSACRPCSPGEHWYSEYPGCHFDELDNSWIEPDKHDLRSVDLKLHAYRALTEDKIIL